MEEILIKLSSSLVPIVAAFVGFGGVIYSQRAIARQSEQARLHKESNDERRASEERRRELVSFMNAVLGELSALEIAIGRASKLLLAQIGVAQEAAAQSGGKTQPRVAFRFMTPVLDTHIGKVGVLNPDLAFKLSNIYGHVLSLGAQAQEQTPQLEATLAVRIMRSVEENLKSLSAEIADLKAELEFAASTAGT